MKKLLIAMAPLAFFTACASNTGIVPTGQGNYMVARQAATGFPGLGTLKADALREADQFCTSQGKALGATSATENQGPFILGKYPRAEVQFTCAPK